MVLAGGEGRRMGGSKALVELNHRPLISYPLEAVWRALGSVTIIAKPDTELPSVSGAAVWIEPREPRHPLTGIIHALSFADGRPVLICASDMPLVTSALIAEIAGTDPGHAPAVVATLQGEIQPLLGRYEPSALAALSALAADPGIRLRDAVAALHPVHYEVEDPDLLFNVNSPDELLQAVALLDNRARYPNVKS